MSTHAQQHEHEHEHEQDVEQGHGWPVLRIVTRMIVSVLVAIASVAVADALLPGFNTDELARFSIWFALLNGIAMPLVVRLAYRFIVYTAGIGALIINALVVLLAAEIVPGVEVRSFGSAIIVSLVVTAAMLILNTILAIDDDGPWMRMVVRRAAQRSGLHPSITGLAPGEQPTPGVIMFEIDGCSHPVLQRAIRAGWMPHLHKRIREGSHVLRMWETDLSSQTGASQAGLLLGSDEGIVAFRWYDRAQRRVMVSSAPKDAMELEDRLSNGRGLLLGGASRNNLFGGDAAPADSALTLSRMLRPGGAGNAYGAFFAQPFNVTRTIVLAVRDIASELFVNGRMRRRRVWPRLDHKGWKYPMVRVATTVVLRDVTCQMLVGDMMRGVPVAYATFVGYDEVAHHDGVERPQALDQLRQLDIAFDRVMRAAERAPRPYEFVILSDHGQSHGATFLQRFGHTLEELVQRNLAGTATLRAYVDPNEPEAQFQGATPGAAALAASSVADESETVEQGDADVLVMASGNLGLVYFTGRDERATLEQLQVEHPGLVEAVASHHGVGFVLVATEHDGPVVFGPGGRHHLRDGRVEGVDPLAVFGPRAVEKLLRHDAFENVPDLLVVSMYDPATDEVAAFEELIGSHGGMGGEQEHPFVLHPASWPEPAEPLHGAPAVHRQLVRWLEACGARTPR